MIHSLRRNKAAAALALALGLAGPARQAPAAQIVEAGDGGTIYARLSKKEMTRLALEHGRIAALRVREGELGMDPDEETGQLFLSVPDGASKPVNGFLTTDAGHTYTLVLQIVDAPADSIIVKQPRTAAAPRADFKAASYDKAVKRLVTVMANDELPDDIQLKEIGRRLDLWQEAALTLEREYVAGEIVGERYLVANVSREAMVLDEREFYRKGVGAVALDQLNLAPGASTRLYVIRGRSPNE